MPILVLMFPGLLATLEYKFYWYYIPSTQVYSCEISRPNSDRKTFIVKVAWDHPYWKRLFRADAAIPAITAGLLVHETRCGSWNVNVRWTTIASAVDFLRCPSVSTPWLNLHTLSNSALRDHLPRHRHHHDYHRLFKARLKLRYAAWQCIVQWRERSCGVGIMYVAAVSWRFSRLNTLA